MYSFLYLMYGSYHIMKLNSNMLVVLILCIVFVILECSPQLKPVVGQKFQSLDFAYAFYDVYARTVGFDTRKQGMRKAADGVTTRYSVVCNREGSKRSILRML